jgi:hypothetical protein
MSEEERHRMPIAVHDIVQITDATHAWYPCLMVVSEVKTWGVQAWAFIPKSNDGSEPPGQAYNRLRWAQVEKVGTAIIVPGPEPAAEGGPGG